MVSASAPELPDFLPLPHRHSTLGTLPGLSQAWLALVFGAGALVRGLWCWCWLVSINFDYILEWAVQAVAWQFKVRHLHASDPASARYMQMSGNVS